MQARISQITTHSDRDIKVTVILDIHNGHGWHLSACLLYADTVHEGARIGLAMCKALDSEPDTVQRRPR